MTKQEQIEKMAKIACATCAPHNCCPLTANFRPCDAALEYAEAIYNAGYRKADEVRNETAKEILDKLNALMEQYHYKSTAWRNCANFIKETYSVEIEK